MGVNVHFHWTFLARPGADLFARCDALMGALLAQEQCESGLADAAVSADADEGTVEIEIDAAGNDLPHALAVGHSAIRAALHEVGVGTPDWPSHDEVMSMVLKELRTEQLV